MRLVQERRLRRFTSFVGVVDLDRVGVLKVDLVNRSRRASG